MCECIAKLLKSWLSPLEHNLMTRNVILQYGPFVQVTITNISVIFLSAYTGRS